MKKILLSSVLFCCIYFSYAQFGMLDLSFGTTGIVKSGQGLPFNYSHSGKQVLLSSDGSMYLIVEGAGLSLITRKHPDGSTDLTYGINGISVSVPIYVAQAALQTDGKIVIVGTIINAESYSEFATVRFNVDGSLDSSFAGDGIQTLSFRDTEGALAVAIQSDGKIVVEGFVFNGSSQFIAIVRFNVDGSLDDSFAGGGIQTTDFGFNDYFNSIAIQTDGKIVVGGTALMRYDSNGSLDSNFNGVGRQVVPGEASAIAIQNDDKIIVASKTSYDGVIIDFGLSRYNTAGILDSTFSEDGIQTTRFGAVIQTATTMAIQNNGKIALAGYTGNDSSFDFAIARYDTDGNLDSSFSDDGIQITDLGSSNDHVNSLKIQSDGKLVALGTTDNGVNTYASVARYNIDGNPDSSFDGNGTLIDHISQGSTFYTSTAIQTDGKILAAGYTWNGSNYDFALIRYNTNGSPDNTFSADGKQMTDFGSTDDKARTIGIQTNGKIVVAGSAGGNFALARYNSDGTPDIAFNTDGLQTTDFGFSDSVTSIAFQSDGKILAGGTTIARYNTNGSLDLSFDGATNFTTRFGNIFPFNCNDLSVQNDGKIIIAGGVNDLIVARYNKNGSLDSTFGENGTYFIYDHVGKSVAIQSDGKIVIGGYWTFISRIITTNFVLIRLNTDGTIDDTFNSGQVVYTYIGQNTYASSVIIQNDNKIILAGSAFTNSGNGDDFTIARYNTNGSLDYTFGSSGIVVTQTSIAYDRIAGIAISGNKLYAAGYGQYPGNFGVVARYLVGPEEPFITGANGNWNDPGTWVGGIVPYSTSAITIRHNVTITTNTTCHSLKVESSGGNLTIATGVNLTIAH